MESERARISGPRPESQASRPWCPWRQPRRNCVSAQPRLAWTGGPLVRPSCLSAHNSAVDNSCNLIVNRMLIIPRGVNPRRQLRATFVKKFRPDGEGDESTRADKDGDACTGAVAGMGGGGRPPKRPDPPPAQNMTGRLQASCPTPPSQVSELSEDGFQSTFTPSSRHSHAGVTDVQDHGWAAPPWRVSAVSFLSRPRI